MFTSECGLRRVDLLIRRMIIAGKHIWLSEIEVNCYVHCSKSAWVNSNVLSPKAGDLFVQRPHPDNCTTGTAGVAGGMEAKVLTYAG